MNGIVRHQKVSSILLCTTLVLAPALALAQGDAGSAEASALARHFVSQLNDAIVYPLIALMMAVALLVFLYGAFNFVRGANNESVREQGRRHLLYGVIGLLVMLCALAILYIAAGTFDLENELDDSIVNTGIGVSGEPRGAGGGQGNGNRLDFSF